MTTTNTTTQKVPDSAANYLEYLERELPSLCTPHDLVAVGLFKDRVEVTEIRRSVDGGPEYLRLGKKKFRYTKEAVLAWVRKSAIPQAEEQAA